MQADDDESDSGVDEDEFSFYRFYVDMGTYHYRHQASQNVSIYSDECMEYLTGGADRSVIMNSPFVKSHWDLIEKMGRSPEEIDLFDDSTWGNDNFSALYDAIWNEIAIHASHQQRCENYVQLAALVS